MDAQRSNVDFARERFALFAGWNIATIDWDTHDIRRLLEEGFTDDIRLEHFSTGLDTRGGHGIDDYLAYLKDWVGAFDEYFVEPLDHIAVGDHVVTPTRQWGVGKSSGARVGLEITWLSRFRDGKIDYQADFDTLDEAMAVAAGVSDERS